MRLTVLPSALKAALDVAGKPVNNRATLPVLSHVLLDATQDDGLLVAGTDLESRAWKTIAAKVEAPGAVCLPLAQIAGFVGLLADADPLVITVGENHKATLTSGRAQIKAPGLDAEQFPVAPDFDQPPWTATIAAPALADLIGSVAHALARDESRPVLCGVYLVARDGRLLAEAADGHRLARRRVDAQDAGDVELVVHGRRLVEASRLLASSTSVTLTVDARGSSLLVDTEAGCWAVRLLDGRYPDANRVIPREYAGILRLDRVAFLGAVRLANTVAKDGSWVVKLRPDDGALTVLATADDRQAESEISAETVSGAPMAIAFNGDYLADALDALDAHQSVDLRLTATDRPATLIPADDPSGDAVQVMMPMIIAGGG